MSKIYYERPQNSPENKKIQDMQKSTGLGNAEEILQPKSFKDLIVNAVLIVLSIAFVINIFVAGNLILEMNYTYTWKEDDFWYAIEEGKYGDLIRETWANRFNNVRETEGLKQCYGVAEYCEAAALYKVAMHTGDIEKQEKYAAIMEKNIDYFYDIMYIAEDIHEKLGIE